MLLTLLGNLGMFGTGQAEPPVQQTGVGSPHDMQLKEKARIKRLVAEDEDWIIILRSWLKAEN